MELKQLLGYLGLKKGQRSNRTFMELKHKTKNCNGIFRYVLIAPLWN